MGNRAVSIVSFCFVFSGKSSTAFGGSLPRGYNHRMQLSPSFAFFGNQLGRLIQGKGKSNLSVIEHYCLYYLFPAKEACQKLCILHSFLIGQPKKAS